MAEVKPTIANQKRAKPASPWKQLKMPLATRQGMKRPTGGGKKKALQRGAI